MERRRPKGSRLNPQDYLQRTIGRIVLVLEQDSKGSEKALRFAAGMSKMCGASVTILCPIEPPLPYPVEPMAPGMVSIVPARAWEVLEDRARTALAAAQADMASLGAGAEGRMFYAVGGASTSVSRMIENESDLIIVGTKEAHGPDRLFQRN